MVVAVVALGGCAERGLVAAPRSRPGTGTWVAVWLAGALAALVIGVLLTLPAWRSQTGSRLAAAVLAAQTGAAAVAGLVLAGVAARSWELAGRSADAAPAVALVRLSRVDGDGSFFALMTLVVALLTAGLVVLLSTATVLVRGEDAAGRWVACSLLGLEVLGAGAAIAPVLLGQRGWPFLGPALAFPVLVAALVSCWPRSSTAPAEAER